MGVKYTVINSIGPHVRVPMTVAISVGMYSEATAASAVPKNELVSTFYMLCRPDNPAFRRVK